MSLLINPISPILFSLSRFLFTAIKVLDSKSELIGQFEEWGSYFLLLNQEVTARNDVQSVYEDLLMITVGFDLVE